ncbi:MAG: hypothetical protein G01um101417_656 [Parcubacteria group bacterium Gr01-1014_17]|jgi:flagellar basal body-associated protein FliL|nr:MAG: hypothetical protein G01um101417_656 [Parcubacteria group bacterium Gr01-1014_17]
MEPQNAMPMGEPKKSGVGALIGSIIIILILVLGALYFWGGKLQTGEEELNFDESSAAVNASASDEVSDIDADLNKLESVNLDEDLNALQ